MIKKIGLVVGFIGLSIMVARSQISGGGQSGGQGGGTSANPSASVGLAAVNGSATTFMTSDSAPPISQSIAPTWTAIHTFGAGSEVYNSSAPANQRRSIMYEGTDGSLFIKPINDSGTISTTSYLQLVTCISASCGTNNNYNGFFYTDPKSGTFQINNSDLRMAGLPNTTPGIWLWDPGTTSPLGFITVEVAGTSYGIPDTDGYMMCTASGTANAGAVLANGLSSQGSGPLSGTAGFCTVGVGTNSNSIPAPSSANELLEFGNNNKQAGWIDASQNWYFDENIESYNATSHFTVASGTGVCSGATYQAGGPIAGNLKCPGTSGSGTVTLTLPAAQTAHTCTGRDVTTAAATWAQTGALSTTSVTITLGASALANDIIEFHCLAY